MQATDQATNTIWVSIQTSEPKSLIQFFLQKSRLGLDIQPLRVLYSHKCTVHAHRIVMANLIKTDIQMPNSKFAGFWNSIVVDASIKERLLRATALNLRLRADLPFETTALHGLVLLYGPPGTGKTTLARGLAHQVAAFTTSKKAQFIEVDPHGMMSAEHGESQKAVTQLLTEQIPGRLKKGVPCVVLLDEIESMAIARSEASLATNPVDVHRATGAVLAALDSSTVDFPDLVFVATSNFVGVLDEAFRSRVDVAIHVPTPNKAGRVQILQHALRSMSQAYPRLGGLAGCEPGLQEVAALLDGADGRRVRKTILEALLIRQQTVLDPGTIEVDDLCQAAQRIMDEPTTYSLEMRN